MDYKSICNASKVCSLWNRISNCDILFEERLRFQFPLYSSQSIHECVDKRIKSVKKEKMDFVLDNLKHSIKIERICKENCGITHIWTISNNGNVMICEKDEKVLVLVKRDPVTSKFTLGCLLATGLSDSARIYEDHSFSFSLSEDGNWLAFKNDRGVFSCFYIPLLKFSSLIETRAKLLKVTKPPFVIKVPSNGDVSFNYVISNIPQIENKNKNQTNSENENENENQFKLRGSCEIFYFTKKSGCDWYLVKTVVQIEKEFGKEVDWSQFVEFKVRLPIFLVKKENSYHARSW